MGKHTGEWQAAFNRWFKRYGDRDYEDQPQRDGFRAGYRAGARAAISKATGGDR